MSTDRRICIYRASGKVVVVVVVYGGVHFPEALLAADLKEQGTKSSLYKLRSSIVSDRPAGEARLQYILRGLSNGVRERSGEMLAAIE